MTSEETLPRDYKLAPKQDYTVRRKVIWKGKVAPKGFYYVAVRVKSKRGHVDAVRLVKGGKSVMVEEKVGKELRELIKEKHKI